MTIILAAQLLVPIAFVLWMLLAPARNRLGRVLQLAASLACLAALAWTGIWMFPPWWTPHAAAVLLLAAAAWTWVRRPPTTALPRTAIALGSAALFTVLGTAAVFYGAQARSGALPHAPPAPRSVPLSWPLQGSTFLIANGGSELLVNSHLESMLSGDPRYVRWRGNAWAVDFIAIDRFGLRAPGFRPADPSRYRIFGLPVLAPCAGSVAVAVDGLPDMPVPQYDRANLAGNHVILACGDVHVALAHFRHGSLQVSAGQAVSVGQLLGEVGNSGGSDEPHLHLHAQRAGPAGAPMGGDPLPMSFGGRFLVRGDRVDLGVGARQ